MDLNKEIKFNFDIKQLKDVNLQKLKGPLVILVLSIIVFLYCIGNIINRFANQDTLIANQNQIINLSQQKTDVANQLNEMASSNKAILKYINDSPKTKSEMTSVLTKLVSLYRIKLIKLTMGENSNQLDPNLANQDPNNSNLIIDLEGIGTFKNIAMFANKLKEVLAASQIESFKLAKLEENKGLQVNLIVKFSQPPNDLFVPESIANLIYDDGYSLAFKNNPNLRPVGFVEIEKNLNQMDNNVDGDIVPPLPSNEVLIDPFAEPINSPNRAGQGIQVGEDGQPLPEPMYFLSGVLDSNEYRLCTVNMPSGETKIFSENQKINDQITILGIQEDSIKICGVCKGNFKEIMIGEEISL